MRKFASILISAILVISFSALVWYALRYSRGMPVAIEKIEKVSIEVPFVDSEIDLTKSISQDIWESVPSNEVKLMYQLMVLPWPKIVTPSVIVKAFHNQKEIYFYLSWQDDTEDRNLETNKFSDACAIMFPMAKEAQPSSIMMGFIGHANIWQWKASQDREFWLHQERESKAYADFHYPFEEDELFSVSKDILKSSANDLIAIRVGTITPKESQNVHGRGFWNNGSWKVVFKRPLVSVNLETDAVFKLGETRLLAFAVWNGSKGDRGGRKSISDWVELMLK